MLILSSTIIQLVVQTLFQRRFEVPDSLYFASIVFLLLLILQHIVVSKREEGYITKIQAGNSASDLEAYLRDREVKSADFLEYSGEHMSSIIVLLHERDNGCKIRVLLVDPRTAMRVSFEQAARIVKNYRENLKPILKMQDSRLELGFYESPPSIRGRNLDDIHIQLSWYTFVTRHQSGNTIVNGEDNPFLTVYGFTLEGQTMREFFNDHFEDLWESRTEPDTVDKWIDLTYNDIARRLRNAEPV